MTRSSTASTSWSRRGRTSTPPMAGTSRRRSPPRGGGAVLGSGIDVGARWVHVVAVADGQVVDGDVLPASEVDAVVDWVRAHGPVRRVAVDAPSALSPLAHADDESLAPKFRAARCGEIALGRVAGVWVPWVSPCSDDEIAPWIAVGL